MLRVVPQGGYDGVRAHVSAPEDIPCLAQLSMVPRVCLRCSHSVNFSPVPDMAFSWVLKVSGGPGVCLMARAPGKASRASTAAGIHPGNPFTASLLT
jgi:hypothetical protein